MNQHCISTTLRLDLIASYCHTIVYHQSQLSLKRYSGWIFEHHHHKTIRICEKSYYVFVRNPITRKHATRRLSLKLGVNFSTATVQNLLLFTPPRNHTSIIITELLLESYNNYSHYHHRHDIIVMITLMYIMMMIMMIHLEQVVKQLRNIVSGLVCQAL